MRTITLRQEVVGGKDGSLKLAADVVVAPLTADGSPAGVPAAFRTAHGLSSDVDGDIDGDGDGDDVVVDPEWLASGGGVHVEGDDIGDAGDDADADGKGGGGSGSAGAKTKTTTPAAAPTPLLDTTVGLCMLNQVDP
jgi:hypothetical protein